MPNFLQLATTSICQIQEFPLGMLIFRQKSFYFCTGCVRQNENPTKFKIVKEPLLIQKQTLHQQKTLDLSYLEPEGQGRGIIMKAWQYHRRQRVKNPILKWR